MVKTIIIREGKEQYKRKELYAEKGQLAVFNWILIVNLIEKVEFEKSFGKRKKKKGS